MDQDWTVAVSGMDRQWEVEYARFFNFPIPIPSADSVRLRRLPPKRTTTGGTWLVSSSSQSSALLRIVKSHFAKPLLSILLHGIIVEHHIVSNLKLWRPQSRCALDCPDNAGKIVLFTFIESSSTRPQTQKFAVRFPTCIDAHDFFTTAQESTDGILGIQGSDLTCEENSHSSHQSIVDFIPKGFDSDKNTFPKPSFSTSLDFPPSFRELLINCQTKVPEQLEQSGTPLNSQTELSATVADISDLNLETQTETCKVSSFLTESTDVCLSELANALENPISEVALNPSELLKYMSDASFMDMLATVKSVITELGSDLLL
ncbi:hypothetical protein ZOSMA_88G00410 [Zostera marina]|uniref:Poor homologous synapsis 1 PH domain-containing protein n=1 Tax=Zostera marina TaxID=29655 RepID=A0A0K9NMC3_ZOSMR|nr:hypothetical protein ZOSMA_88G00410 [Zostera marina]